MRSKLTLSIEKEIIRKAKQLAAKNKATVSAMFTDFVELRSQTEDKLQALHEISGIVDSNLAAEPGDEYQIRNWKKHGW